MGHDSHVCEGGEWVMTVVSVREGWWVITVLERERFGWAMIVVCEGSDLAKTVVAYVLCISRK